MTEATANSTFLRLGLGDPASTDVAAALRSLNSRHVMLPVHALPGAPVHADVIVQAAPELRLMSAAFCGIAQTAAAERELRDTCDDLFFGVTLSGKSVARQRGRELLLNTGQAVVLTRGEAGFSLTHPAPVRFIGLRVSRRVLAGRIPNLDDAVMTLAESSPSLRLLTTYVAAVTSERMLSSPEERHLVARHVHELLALALSRALGFAAPVQGTSVRAARLFALQRDIVRRLEDPSLSVGGLATRHKVTPRYVHKLFEESGATFSEFVLGKRLELVHARLLAPQYLASTISELAFGSGFSDLSYFNRTFRRRYGRTPSEVRRAAALRSAEQH